MDNCILNLYKEGLPMKYEITSLNTKKLFAEALKKIILEKSFSKVTVSELIRECKVNRKTFYYHFSDIYDLLKWTLEQEAIDVVKNFDLIVDYEEAILFVIDYIKVNNKFLNNIYDSLGRDELKRFFYTDFVGIVEIIIGKAEEETHKKIPDNLKKFLAAFYTEAIAGILVERITHQDQQSKEELVTYISAILRSSLTSVVREFPNSLDSLNNKSDT